MVPVSSGDSPVWISKNVINKTFVFSNYLLLERAIVAYRKKKVTSLMRENVE